MLWLIGAGPEAELSRNWVWCNPRGLATTSWNSWYKGQGGMAGQGLAYREHGRASKLIEAARVVEPAQQTPQLWKHTKPAVVET